VLGLPRPELRTASGGQDPAAERAQEPCQLLADAAVADDPDRQLGQLPPAKRLPGALALELQELREAARDGQRHHDHVLRDRAAEDAARVRHQQAALADGGRRDAIDASRRGVDPAQARRARHDVIEDRCRHRAEQEHLGLVEGGLVGVAMDAAVCRDPGAAHAIDRLDSRRELARQRRTENRGGQDGE
jgi:hypothetical protein